MDVGKLLKDKEGKGLPKNTAAEDSVGAEGGGETDEE
jgi:hypothetical protein